MAAVASALCVCFSCYPCHPPPSLRRWIPTRDANVIAVDMFSGDPFMSYPRMRIRRSIQILASSPNKQVDNSDDATSFKEDLSYLLKLGVGSLAGAAVIKYGSIIFPEITRPNILQALIMISTPTVIAVFLLIKQSREAE